MKKIADLPDVIQCFHPSHDPPKHIVLKPGIYEHTCPKCFKKKRVVINRFGKLGSISITQKEGRNRNTWYDQRSDVFE